MMEFHCYNNLFYHYLRVSLDPPSTDASGTTITWRKTKSSSWRITCVTCSRGVPVRLAIPPRPTTLTWLRIEREYTPKSKSLLFTCVCRISSIILQITWNFNSMLLYESIYLYFSLPMNIHNLDNEQRMKLTLAEGIVQNPMYFV